MKFLLPSLLILLFGCKSKINDLNSLCEGIDNSYKCAQKIEAYQIPRFDDLVKRVEGKLMLKIETGNEIELENKDKGADGVWFTFRDFMENINAYLVEVHYYEGGRYALISKTSGMMVGVPGKINVSPDHQRFISFNLDLESQFTPNGFVIYSIKNGIFLKELEMYPDDWGPSNINWINGNQIQIEKTEWKNGALEVSRVITYEYNKEWRQKQ